MSMAAKNFNYFGMVMKAIIFSALFVVSTLVTAAPDPRLCEMFGLLAKGIAEDRDQGTPFNKESAKLKAAAAGLPSTIGINEFSKGAMQTIYRDMPKLTPEGAYKLHYVACMSAG